MGCPVETSPTRRRAAGLAVAILTLSATAACGGVPAPTASVPPPDASTIAPTTSPGAPSNGSSGSPGSATPSDQPTEEAIDCTKRVSDFTVPQQVGQLLMVGVTSTGLTTDQSTALADTHAGSAILLGNSGLGTAETALVVSDVRDAADPPSRISTVVAADQEGGRVQRLQGKGFSDLPSAMDQRLISDAALTKAAGIWSKELDKAGINVNLAPVADVVPANLRRVNAPVGQLQRGYGPSPELVARKVTAFIEGMDESNLGTAVKHFPGLGRVRGNTDVTSRVVDSVTTRKDATLAGFKAGIAAKTEMMMMSSAYYRKIDPKRRAAFSPVVINDMLRGDLGFTGVVVSDDLSAVAMRDLAPGARAIRFVNAGGDLAIVGNSAEAEPMAKALVARAKSDPRFAERVVESATRVVNMKATLGLASCD